MSILDDLDPLTRHRINRGDYPKAHTIVAERIAVDSPHTVFPGQPDQCAIGYCAGCGMTLISATWYGGPNRFLRKGTVCSRNCPGL